MRPPKKIILVDSNEWRLSERTFLLRTRGYTVLPCESAAEALELLDIFQPRVIDLLVVDLLLSGTMGGNELCRRAKQAQPEIKTLIFSNTVSNYDRAMMADAFLPKEMNDSTQLLERVKILVARKRGPKKKYPQPEAVIDQAGTSGVPARVA